MNRKISYHIGESEAGMRIDAFLRRKGYSRQNLTVLKKMPESILVNDVWRHMTYMLSADETLTIHIQEDGCSEKIPPVKLPLDILYEDEDILVVNKPAGMPIHPSLNNYYNSLANGLAWYFKERNKPFIFRCTNRLDRDTSGLTIIAKHMVSSGILSEMVRHHTISREYVAIVRGQVTPEEGTITAPLSRKDGSIIERQVDYEHGETAVTHYKVIDVDSVEMKEFISNKFAKQEEQDSPLSLISLHLETGRTHQIRIHMKHLGYPLIGDYLYNPDMEYIERQALHSYRMQFVHPMTGEHMDFVAPLPTDMCRALQGKRRTKAEQSHNTNSQA